MHIFLRDKSLLTQSHKSDHNNNKKYTRKVNVMQESRPSRTSVYLAIMQTAGWKKNKREKIQCARSRVTKIFFCLCTRFRSCTRFNVQTRFFCFCVSRGSIGLNISADVCKHTIRCILRWFYNCQVASHNQTLSTPVLIHPEHNSEIRHRGNDEKEKIKSGQTGMNF